MLNKHQQSIIGILQNSHSFPVERKRLEETIGELRQS